MFEKNTEDGGVLATEKGKTTNVVKITNPRYFDFVEREKLNFYRTRNYDDIDHFIAELSSRIPKCAFPHLFQVVTLATGETFEILGYDGEADKFTVNRTIEQNGKFVDSHFMSVAAALRKE